MRPNNACLEAPCPTSVHPVAGTTALAHTEFELEQLMLHKPACRYPLAIVKDLDPQRPTAASLLGIPVVIWQDGKGAWNCFDDRCPHRCVCVYVSC